MRIIRPERKGDEEGIHRVLCSAFPTPLEAKLVAALRNADKIAVSLVSEESETIIGFIGFSGVTVEGLERGLGLAPLAVEPDSQRRGIGTLLVQQGLADCINTGAPFVVVLGDPKFYRRFGFRPASEWGLQDEYGGGDAFQVLELHANGIPKKGGLVRYAPEFQLVEDGH